MSWDDIKEIVTKYAPAVGAILAPLTGGASVAAGALIANVLGVENTPQAVVKAVQNDPEAAIKLQTLLNEKAFLDLEVKKIESADRQNADANITQRWLSDNTAGGLPAITRPLLVWFFSVMFTVFALIDGNVTGFEIKSAYVNLYGDLLVTCVLAYVSLRSFEKYKGVQNDEIRK